MSIKTTLLDQINGNLDNKFGLELPIPFVEGVTIGTENIVITNTIYLNLDSFGAENIDDVVKKMAGIKFYNMLAYDRSYTNTSGSDVVNDYKLSNIIEGKKSALSALGSTVTYVESGGNTGSLSYPAYTSNVSNAYEMPAISDWSVVDTYYNDSLQPVVKITSTTTINSEVATFLADPNNPLSTDSLPDMVENSPNSRNTLINVGALAFSTVLDLSTDYDNIVDAYEHNLGARYLYNGLTSDINSLIFYKDGVLNPLLNIVYLTETGEIITNALQSLDTQYYSPDTITLPELVAFFKALIGSSNLEDLQEMYDAFSTLLMINDQNTSLLLEISSFLETFTNKGNASPVGRFYGRIQKRLVQANKLVLKGLLCTKQQLKMPIIIDSRGGIIESVHSSYTIPDPDDYSAEDFIYTNSIYMSRTQYSEDNDFGNEDDVLVDAGYLFFDYEKLLAKKSKISQRVDPKKIEHHFGKEAIAAYFYMESAYMALTDVSANSCSETESPLFTLTTKFEDSTPTNIPTSYNIEMAYSNTTDEIGDNFVYEDSQYGNSHYYLRNFNSTDPSTLTTTQLRADGGFYRIMCYDFKYIIKNPSPIFNTTGTYTLTFEVQDHTQTVYYNLIRLARVCLESIQNYTEFAGDYCSYNDTDGLFNQFFIDAVIETYEGTDNVPPWIMAPYMYVLLQDIFANEYKGEKEKIQDAAKDLSDLISPYAGSLEQLQEFTNSFAAIFDELFPESDQADIMLDILLHNTAVGPDGTTYEDRRGEDLITITTTWSLPQVKQAYITDVEITDPEDEVVVEEEEEEESDPNWEKVGDSVKFEIKELWALSNNNDFFDETHAAGWYDLWPAGSAGDIKDEDVYSKYFSDFLDKLKDWWDDNWEELTDTYTSFDMSYDAAAPNTTGDVWSERDKRQVRAEVTKIDIGWKDKKSEIKLRLFYDVS